MSMVSRLTSRAIEFADAGRRQDAVDLLRAAIRQDPHYEAAWREYVRLLPSVEERMEALKAFLRLEPAHRSAREALWSLWEGQRGELRAERDSLKRALGRATVALGLAFVVLLGLVAGLVVVRQEIVDVWVARTEALEARYETLQDAHDRLLAAYSELQLADNDLRQTYAALVAAHGVLAGEHGALQQSHDSLTAEHDDLLATHSTLQESHSALAAENDVLAARFAELEQQSSSLWERNDWLEVNALVPPYIAVEGRTVYMVFMRSDGTVDGWETPFESLERSIEMGIDKRAGSLWGRDPVVNLDNPDTGEQYSLWDYRAFVNPDPFETVMGDLYAEMPGGYELIHETWHIVSQLTTYSEDIGETPRYPLETFLAGGGDCEDTSILLASMIKAAPVPWRVELVYMDIEHPEAPQDVNHVIVYIDTGEREYYIETTNHEIMEPYSDILAWHFEVG